jgi:hypothetical protein
MILPGMISRWLRLTDVRADAFRAMLVKTERGGMFSFKEIKKWLKDAGF